MDDLAKVFIFFLGILLLLIPGAQLFGAILAAWAWFSMNDDE